MVALLGVSAGDFGVIRERVTYSSYGVPQGLPPGDLDNDGDSDGADETLWYTLHAGGAGYDVRADLNLDGVLDVSDEAMMIGAAVTNFTSERGILSRDNGAAYAVGNRKGYAGYEHDGIFHTMCHVRHRVLLTELGRWSRRDPLGYVDGMGLYEYVSGEPASIVDPLGLFDDPLVPGSGTPSNPKAPDRDSDQAPVDPGNGGGYAANPNHPCYAQYLALQAAQSEYVAAVLASYLCAFAAPTGAGALCLLVAIYALDAARGNLDSASIVFDQCVALHGPI